MAEQALRQKSINTPTAQNPDAGGQTLEPRCRAFGVLGFDDSPEAQIGGTLLHKVSEEESERRNG